ncbi:hypothetical protein D3C73_1630480 [compost metagenome]
MNSEEINRTTQMALMALLACLLAMSDEVTEAGCDADMAASCREFLGDRLV